MISGLVYSSLSWASPVAGGKESAGSAGDTGSIPGSGRSLEGGNGSIFVCLENPMDSGAWQAMVCRVET